MKQISYNYQFFLMINKDSIIVVLQTKFCLFIIDFYQNISPSDILSNNQANGVRWRHCVNNGQEMYINEATNEKVSLRLIIITMIVFNFYKNWEFMSFYFGFSAHFSYSMIIYHQQLKINKSYRLIVIVITLK